MKILIIFNTIICTYLLGKEIISLFNNNFYFEVERTFWKGKAYGIGLWKITSGTYNHGTSEKIFIIYHPKKNKILSEK